MPITSSTYTLGPVQADGRRYCEERHTDHTGFVHVIEYLASVGVDPAAVLAARATALPEIFKERELRYAVFDAPWDYALQWANNSDLSAWVRAAYKSESRETLAKIAKRILEWITNGRYTDAQVRAAFSLTSAQWTTLKNKMIALVADYDAVQVAVGE